MRHPDKLVEKPLSSRFIEYNPRLAQQGESVNTESMNRDIIHFMADCLVPREWIKLTGTAERSPRL